MYLDVPYCLSKHSYDRVVDLDGGSMIRRVTELPNLLLRNFWTTSIAPKHCVNLKISATHIFGTNLLCRFLFDQFHTNF